MKEEELSDGFDIEDDEVLLEDPLSIVGKKLILIEDDEVLLEIIWIHMSHLGPYYVRQHY